MSTMQHLHAMQHASLESRSSFKAASSSAAMSAACVHQQQLHDHETGIRRTCTMQHAAAASAQALYMGKLIRSCVWHLAHLLPVKNQNEI
jgi:hypothetical protein